MKKRIRILASLGLLVHFFVPLAQADFADVMSHWAASYINDLAAQGVVSGYENGLFGPDDALTRGQMAKIIVLAFGLDSTGSNIMDYVAAVEENGIAEGYRNSSGALTGDFGEDDPLTRAQAVKMLVLATNLNPTGTGSFTDVPSTQWYYDYVRAAYSNGLVDGYDDGRFGPDDLVTRGQIAKMTVLAENVFDPAEPVSVSSDSTSTPSTSTSFYVDLNSHAYQQIAEWAVSRPSDAADLQAIATQPTAKWFGDWNSDVQSSVDDYVSTVSAAGALPVLVACNIPGRDCGSYSSGGSADADLYRTWIQGFADSVGNREAMVVLEPDALSLDCLYSSSVDLLADAVTILKSKPHLAVYIDAGHPDWVDSADMATRLQAANVGAADGFALNVSNFYTTDENIRYGEAISALIGGKHFIVDTGRNGNGSNGEWCNPSGRSLGENPTMTTGNNFVDAFLWVKPPGESDGTCNGGPSAGTWWADYALGLVRN